MKGIHTAYATIIFALLGVIFLKLGVNSIGHFEITPSFVLEFVLQIFTTPLILLGFFMLFCSSVSWLFTLSKEDLSKVFPLLSLNFVFVPLISVLFFNETFSFLRILAITIISLGVVFLSKT